MAGYDSIDILLATYNGAKFLKVLLDSLSDQTYTNWNLIVSDDFSTDDSMNIIERFQELNPGKLSLVKSSIRLGSGKLNFFFLMGCTKAKYVMFCDQDDYWKPDKLEKSMSKMKEIENKYSESCPLMVFSDLEVVDKNLSVINGSFFKYGNLSSDKRELRNILIQNIFTGCTMLINRPLLDLSVQNQTENIIMHDWWIGLVASAFGKTGYVDEAIIKYRQHESNTIGAKKVKSIRYLAKRLLNARDIRQSMLNTTAQAAFFYETYKDRMTEGQRQLTFGYAFLFMNNRLSRYRFYIYNHIYKHGLAKKIGQFIWG